MPGTATRMWALDMPTLRMPVSASMALGEGDLTSTIPCGRLAHVAILPAGSDSSVVSSGLPDLRCDGHLTLASVRLPDCALVHLFGESAQCAGIRGQCGGAVDERGRGSGARAGAAETAQAGSCGRRWRTWTPLHQTEAMDISRRVEQQVGVPLLRLHHAIYKGTNGRIGHRIPGVPPSLLLHTTGDWCQDR